MKREILFRGFHPDKNGPEEITLLTAQPSFSRERKRKRLIFQDGKGAGNEIIAVDSPHG